MKILGQNRVIRYLSRGLTSQRLSPSLLFVGPDGSGKKTVALELARAFACQDPPMTVGADELPTCGECDGCRRVAGGTHGDVMLLNRAFQADLLNEKPEAQNAVKIEAIRNLDRFLHLLPTESRRRVAIIEDAERMSTESANALLKLLEEPPDHAQIVLLALDEHALPSTIQSRCAVLRFQPLPTTDIAAWLQEKFQMPADLAKNVAFQSNGSLSKALAAKEADTRVSDIVQIGLDEFLAALSEPAWRKEGRKKAEHLVVSLINHAQHELENGDLGQAARLRLLIQAKKQLERFVTPRVALQNLYLQLLPLGKDTHP
jgi:DNA polymerase-3 subunit delta'